MKKRNQKLLVAILILAVIGMLDSGYLTYEHFSDSIPPCSTSPFIDCGKVLKSTYSEVFGFPLAGLGFLHYFGLIAVVLAFGRTKHVLLKKVLVAQGLVGAVFSAYFVYLQLVVLKAICLYCMVSAVNSFVLLPIVLYTYKRYELTQENI